jgi:hypothetical protein
MGRTPANKKEQPSSAKKALSAAPSAQMSKASAKMTKGGEEREEGRPKPRVIQHQLPPLSETAQRRLNDDRNAKRIISDIELEILKYMDKELQSDPDKDNLQVAEISQGTGVRDTDDILRALYTLEGKHLVEPCPPGDFTSSFWRVTPIGQRAVMMFRD